MPPFTTEWHFPMTAAHLRDLAAIARWADTELRGTVLCHPITADYIRRCVDDITDKADDAPVTLRITDHGYRAVGHWFTRHRTQYGADSDRYNDLRATLKMPR